MRVRTRTTFLLATVVALVAGAAGAVLASHQFSDVNDDHVFHDEIDALAGAGITQGYPDGTFRPSTDVTRGAMAAFLARGNTRVAGGDGSGSLSPTTGPTEGVLASATMTAGATGDGSNGFVLAIASVTARTDDAVDCPCEVFTRVHRRSDDQVVAFANYTTMPGEATDTGETSTSVTTTGIIALPTDTTETYDLVVGTTDVDVEEIQFEGDLTAIYAPFGPEGTNTLGTTTSSAGTTGDADRERLAPSTRED